MQTKKFDVWIANSRETVKTKGHKIYGEFDPEYWDFTFYEMATIDIPTLIDYVLK